MTLSQRRGPRFAWQAQATPRVDVAEVSIVSSGLAGSGTKKMKAPSPVLPDHAAAFCLCDADPEYQIFVVLFTGRSRCVRVRASWGVQKPIEVVKKVSEVPAQNFISRVMERHWRNMTTCEEFLLIAGFSCMDGWLVELVSLFLGNGHARCAEHKLLQMRFHESSFSSAIGDVYQWIQGAFLREEWHGALFPSRCPCSGTCACGGDLPKVKKRRLSSVLLFPRPMSQLGKIVGALLVGLFKIGLDESVLGMIREKIPDPPLVEKKKETFGGPP